MQLKSSKPTFGFKEYYLTNLIKSYLPDFFSKKHVEENIMAMTKYWEEILEFIDEKLELIFRYQAEKFYENLNSFRPEFSPI